VFAGLLAAALVLEKTAITDGLALWFLSARYAIDHSFENSPLPETDGRGIVPRRKGVRTAGASDAIFQEMGRSKTG
jgi:hypothetical protein